MPRWNHTDDDWDAKLEDDDLKDGDLEDNDWQDEEVDEPTVPCPYCGCEIHEESQRCPHCENYLSTEESPPPQKPWWLILGAVAGLYAVYRWIVWYNGPGM